MRKTTFWLALLSLTFVLPVLQYIFADGLVPGTSIYLAHFLDLVLNAPLLVLVFLSTFLALKAEGAVQPNCRISLRLLLWLAALSVLFMLEGHGIHYTANSLSALIDRHTAPANLVKLDYIYDEYVGHYLLLVGLTGLLYVLMLFEWRHPNQKRASTVDKVAITLAAVVAGSACGLIVLESQAPWLGLLALSVVSITAWLSRLHQTWYHGRPFGTFLLVACLTTVLVLAGWASRYGKFVEPSVRHSKLIEWVVPE